MSDPYVPANKLWRVVLRLFRTPALTMPWGRVYYRAEIRKPGLEWMDIRLHEDVHLEQIARMGGTLFAITYIWQLARYGYWQAPLEIEARAAYE
jgi:hypothetical protein